MFARIINSIVLTIGTISFLNSWQHNNKLGVAINTIVWVVNLFLIAVNNQE